MSGARDTMGHMKDLDRRIRQGGDDAIAAVGELLPRWISVEERLPDRYVRVLAFVQCEPHDHPHAIGFLGATSLWSLDGICEPSEEITHWMLLPEPPEAK
jgi:hypothetical protein